MHYSKRQKNEGANKQSSKYVNDEPLQVFIRYSSDIIYIHIYIYRLLLRQNFCWLNFVCIYLQLIYSYTWFLSYLLCSHFVCMYASVFISIICSSFGLFVFSFLFRLCFSILCACMCHYMFYVNAVFFVCLLCPS